MAPSQNQHDTPLGDPIELVTRFVTNQDWLLRRRAENAVLVEVPGKWCCIGIWRNARRGG